MWGYRTPSPGQWERCLPLLELFTRCGRAGAALEACLGSMGWIVVATKEREGWEHNSSNVDRKR